MRKKKIKKSPFRLNQLSEIGVINFHLICLKKIIVKNKKHFLIKNEKKFYEFTLCMHIGHKKNIK